MNDCAAPAPPFWLLAELTYRCPLHCVFCYNPVDFARYEDELSTEDWLRVLREARKLGAVQCGFSGGEPLLRDDLIVLVNEAHRLGYYTNLITSGIGLDDTRLDALHAAGLDHIQLSFQDSTRELNDFLSHTRTFDLKRKVGFAIKQRGFPMVLNCVIHRLNIDFIDKVIDLALDLGVEYLELANAQFYSWAYVNRQHLLPSKEQIDRAEAVVNTYRQRIGNTMRIFFVVPDYYEKRPKRCVNGWGNVLLTIAPDGTALPCHTARMLPGLSFPNVRDVSIENIWRNSAGFNRYRGTGWMKEPCASCPEKEKDLGGCRCQAYMLANDAVAADPVCEFSAHHDVVLAAIEQANALDSNADTEPLIFRDVKESNRLKRPF